MNKSNEIPIKYYLAEMNIKPVRNYGYYGMYHCPFRDDRNASFKVDYRKNVWYDFGANEGGTMIDLVMRMEGCSFHEAAKRLESKYTYLRLGSGRQTNTCVPQENNINSFSFHGDKNIDDESAIEIRNSIPITHPKLTAWTRERKIELELANLYCREIHYRNRDKDYFSIGFRNNRGGYELSSPPDFKGCIPPKDITTIRSDVDTCLVFEGFWDFLSYLAIQKVEKSKHDIVVLNSVANIQKAMGYLKSHKGIYTYLDNDAAGQKATELIKLNCTSVSNRSERYAGFKDLNDYLCGKKLKVELPIKKRKPGLRR